MSLPTPPAAQAVPDPTPAPEARQVGEVKAARIAVLVSFVLAGGAFASWASRLPSTRLSLQLSPGQLGLLILFGAVGSVIALPLAGSIAARLGTAGANLLAGGTLAVGLVWAAFASGVLHSSPLTALGLFAMGAGMGVWDVSMNLEGAEVERRAGRAMMPTFHAAFSLGTVVAAGLGALAAALDVPVIAHMVVIALASMLFLVTALKRYLPVVVSEDDDARAGATAAPRARAAWFEPRTLMIGVLVLSAAFTEGTANDWAGIAAVDGYHLSQAGGALAFALFLSAMTAARLIGQRALDRWGRVPVVRATTALGGIGALLVVFGHYVPVAALGAVLWGAGASLGFPVGMSAAADEPARAAARVSVVSTIGYTAFLAGPPLLGFLGDQVGVLRALVVVALVAVPSLLVTRVLTPPAAPAAHDVGADTPTVEA